MGPLSSICPNLGVQIVFLFWPHLLETKRQEEFVYIPFSRRCACVLNFFFLKFSTCIAPFGWSVNSWYVMHANKPICFSIQNSRSYTFFILQPWFWVVKSVTSLQQPLHHARFVLPGPKLWMFLLFFYFFLSFSSLAFSQFLFSLSAPEIGGGSCWGGPLPSQTD